MSLSTDRGSAGLPGMTAQEQAVDLRQHGHTLQSVADRLGVSVSTIMRWTKPPEFAEKQRRQSREAKQRRRGTCAECGKATSYDNTVGMCTRCYNLSQRYWTRERVIRAIQEWAYLYGRPPSAWEWKRAGEHHPVNSNVYRSVSNPDAPFDTWGDAIEAAGFPRPRTFYHGEWGKMFWTKERTIASMHAWAEKHGKPPTANGWNNGSQDHPSSTWVAQLFGSWNAGIEAAGWVPLPPGVKVRPE